MSMISDHIERVRERVERAAERAGTAPGTVRIIAVSKTKPVSMIQEALAAGLTDLGENRVQEAEEKYACIGDRPRWHLIGHLQTNKARHAARIFHMIQSVDSLSLGEELDRRLKTLGKIMSVLVQVNTSGEASKSGVEPDGAFELVERLSVLSSLSVQGLMTIPAPTPDLNKARPAFRRLRELRDRMVQTGIGGVEMRYLSMGMTHDFETAIEEGANMIRVGTAIFGERTP
ncbi:MAG: YggS family pyridoxal phosphate-dependent enzyme [candidate division Zixibacteria bacterium]|nr:YggS family pyridoxal phosphate-dependent enzyme [candidate division Zixibacteria bacterium]